MEAEEKINPFKMKKAELLDMFRGRCKHGHRYVEHPACYLKEKKDKELRVGYLDIETSNLKANFGIMLSYAIKEKGSKKLYCSTINKKEIDDGTLDKRIVRDCISDMKKFDVVMGYYSTKFDIPFIRSRAMYWGIEFPMYGELLHKDIWYMVRAKMCLHSNRLESACKHLGIEGKTHIESIHWIRALSGDKKALAYILDHNKKDVIILEKLHNRIKEFTRNINRSI